MLFEAKEPPPNVGDGRLARRRRLEVQANPDTRQDYVVEFRAGLSGVPGEGHLTLRLSYVPDRAVLTTEGFADYAAAVEAGCWSSLEEIAVAVLDDMSNELVPRWVRLTMSSEGTGRCRSHRVSVEDRQPDWSNEALVAGLRRD